MQRIFALLVIILVTGTGHTNAFPNENHTLEKRDVRKQSGKSESGYVKPVYENSRKKRNSDAGLDNNTGIGPQGKPFSTVVSGVLYNENAVINDTGTVYSGVVNTYSVNAGSGGNVVLGPINRTKPGVHPVFGISNRFSINSGSGGNVSDINFLHINNTAASWKSYSPFMLLYYSPILFCFVWDTL